MAQNFGGDHTDEKLQKLADYLQAYVTALKRQRFKLVYLDAFAGTADIDVGSVDHPLLFADLGTTIKGSAHRALSVQPPFDSYIFVEKTKSKLKQLEQRLKTDFPDFSERMQFVPDDANDALSDFCSDFDRIGTRGVVFLDPFGNQVEWGTLEAVAVTEAIDLWYLFPAGLGANRLLQKKGEIPEEHAKSLDRIFGPNDWRSAAYQKIETQDLFGDTKGVEKTATAKIMTEFMIDCMRTIFKGGVLSEWLPLGSQGQHMYSLLFAWANPRPKAKLAATLARAVLSKKRR